MTCVPFSLQLLLNLQRKVKQIFQFHINLLIQTIKKSSHCSLTIFLDICSNHDHFHFFVVLLNTLGTLHKILKSIVQFSIVIGWYKSSSHDGFQISPFFNRPLPISSPLLLRIILPSNSIIFKNSNGKL